MALSSAIAVAAAGIAIAGSVAGMVTGIISGKANYAQARQNAKSQQEVLEYNARQEQREAEAIEAENSENARRQRAESERVKSMQRALLGKSGAALTSGSPLAILGETAANQELATLDAHRAGAIAANRRIAQANSYAYQGRVAGNSVSKGMLIGSIGSSIGSGLQGIGSAVSSGASAFGKNS